MTPFPLREGEAGIPNTPVEEPPRGREFYLSMVNTNSELLIFQGQMGSLPIRILIDGGASSHFVDASFLKRHHLTAAPKCTPDLVRYGDGHTKESTLFLPHQRITIGTYHTVEAFHVVDLDGFDVILGKPWLAKVKPHIDWEHNILTFKHKGIEHTLCPCKETTNRASKKRDPSCH